MGSDWQDVTLSSICSTIEYGYTESASALEVGPHFLRITDIQNGVVDWKTVPYCPISEANLAKYKLNTGDIVVARTGNSTGENFMFSGQHDAVFASYLIRFCLDKSRANPSYVWYTMRAPQWWSFIQSSKTGSAQAGANAKTLGLYRLKLPELTEQKAIAHILGTLDDKIELNRQMNQTLEAMAQALFKSWFVDFDPVIDNALAVGKPIPDALQARAAIRRQQGENPDTPALPASLRSLFPSAFEFSETMGWVPEGWTVSEIGKEIEVVGGGTPSTKNPDYWDGGIHAFCTPKDMSSLNCRAILDTERLLTDTGVAKISSGQLPAGTVLMSSRAPIGYLGIAEIPLSVNQGVIAMLPKERWGASYLLEWAAANMEDIKGRANGSTFMEIGKRSFKEMPFLVADNAVTSEYNKQANQLHRKTVSTAQQTNQLTKLRDTLLPKLIAGELRIPDAEKLAAEAGA